MKKRIVLLVLCALLLTACGAEPRETTEPTTEAPPVEELTMVVTAENIAQLEEYPALKTADLTGSTCYKEIQAYQKAHPEVQVIYTVDLNGSSVQPEIEELILEEGQFELTAMREVLPYLLKLKTVSFQDFQLSLEEFEALAKDFSQIDFTYDVEIGEVVCNPADESVNFSSLTWEALEPNLPRLPLLPNLKEINLLTEEEISNLTLEQAVQLQEAVPEVQLLYSFDLFGQTVSTTQEEVGYANKYIGNKIEGAEDTLRQALSIMKGCKRLVLDNCHFTDETLAQLRDDFREQTKIVWRISFGPDGGCLTDRETIRYMPTLTGDGGRRLYYCEDAKYIDFGHNEAMMHCDFIAGMVSLEAVIVSGAPIQDISGFANCPNLHFLELAYCSYVDDISALANCKNLKMLNISYTSVSDLSALDDIDLEIFVDTHSKVSDEERARFEELHPNCLVLHDGTQPYGYPWRYTEDGEWNEYYTMLREIFDYDHPAQTRR